MIYKLICKNFEKCFIFSKRCTGLYRYKNVIEKRVLREESVCYSVRGNITSNKD